MEVLPGWVGLGWAWVGLGLSWAGLGWAGIGIGFGLGLGWVWVGPWRSPALLAGPRHQPIHPSMAWVSAAGGRCRPAQRMDGV